MFPVPNVAFVPYFLKIWSAFPSLVPLKYISIKIFPVPQNPLEGFSFVTTASNEYAIHDNFIFF